MCAQGVAIALPDRTEFEIVFVDLLQAALALEAEELTTPRLSSMERDRFMSRSSSDMRAAQTWRLSRIALRIVLERWAGNDVRRSAFEIERGGRPKLAQGWPHFSISHTGDVALIAVSQHSAIGIDIEQERNIKMSDERRAQVMKAANALSSQHDSRRTPKANDLDDAAILQAWVKLEAVAKATGLGIGRVLTDYGVSHANNANNANERVEDSRVGDDSIRVATIDVGPRYVAAIAGAALPEILKVDDFPHTTSNIALFCQAHIQAASIAR